MKLKRWSRVRIGAFVGAVVGAAVMLSAAARGEDKKVTFENKDSISGWTVSGDVGIDTAKNRDGKEGGSLKVGPGGKAVWKVADGDNAGTVEFWAFEDMAAAEKPKEPGTGALWSVIGADGKAVAVGAIYARYLAGDAAHAAGAYDSKEAKDSPSRKVQYLGVKREAGWHKWTFKMDADKGLSISCDDKDVNGKKKPRFDWSKTEVKGISSIAFTGDATTGGKQVLWIDDLTVSITGPMKAKPGAAAAAAEGKEAAGGGAGGAAAEVPGAVANMPAVDPAPDKPVQLVEAVKGKHPRLVFSESDIPQLKALAQGEGKPFWDQLLAYLPSSKAPAVPNAKDDTDAQRQGLWRAPTVALHYAITKDPKSLENAKGMLEWMVNQEHWETGKELDSGMGAANIAVGAGILYDMLYNDLDPAFREKARKKLLEMARRQYYLGHLNGNHAIGYWQGDPQNNHRWHRDAGLAMCTLAVAGDGPGDEFILSKLHEELDFIAKWLPDDGTSHESPSYWVFGSPHLTLAMEASDRCLGTKYLDLPYFKNAPMFRMQTLCPGLKEVFGYGDFGGTGGINSFTFLSTGHDKEADLQDGLLKFYKADATERDGQIIHPAFEFGVYSMLWFNPDVKGGSINNLPKDYYFDDLGLAFARDGWEENNVAMMFKCAPYGGYKLNDYRREKNLQNVNVAHDDPDVNQFQIYTHGAIVARDDGYSEKKLTSGHNTILVNGVGQRGEGGVWMQPLKGFDMARLGVMTTWKDTGDVVVAEGEGAGAYVGLDRFRRTAIWVKGGYILILDDIRAPQESEITWLVQGDGMDTVDAAKGSFVLKSGEASCPLMVVGDVPLTADVGISTAQHRGKSLDLKQVQAKAKAKNLRIAAVFDPWNVGNLKVTIQGTDADHATVTVTGGNFSDTWTWTAAPAKTYTPSTLKGVRAGGFTVDVGPADQAHIPTKELPAMQAGDAGGAGGGAAKPARAGRAGKRAKAAQ